MGNHNPTYAAIQDLPSGTTKSPTAFRVEFSKRLRNAMANSVDEAALPLAKLDVRINMADMEPILVVKTDERELHFRVTRASLKNLRAEYDKAVSICREVRSSYGGKEA
jgi:hypothetical protein